MTPWWVPLLAALVATVGALLAGDLLTARARLRRTLDKELAIHDRLSDGLAAKARLACIIERQSWELIVRTENAVRTQRILWLLAFSLGVVAMSLVQLRLHIVDPQPDDQPELLIYSWPFVGLGCVGSALVMVRTDRHARKDLVDAAMSPPADPSPAQPAAPASAASDGSPQG